MSTNNFIKIAIINCLLAVAPFLLSACSGSKAEVNINAVNTEPQVVEVTTAQAIVQQIPTYFEATGSLASDAQTDVAPTVGGKVTAVNFDVGSYVNRGDVLVRLDDRDARIRLEQAQAQVQQTQSQVRQAQAGVDQAIANLRQTQARLGVSDGETFNIESFSQVRAIRAQLELAEKELGRATRLLESGDIARTIYDQRKAQRDQLLGQLDEARSNAAVAVKAIDTARAQVETARTGVGNARAAVTTAQTQVDQAQKAVSDTVIYAPISGYVAERAANLGEFVTPNTPNAKVATIVRTAVLRLQIDVPEQAIGRVASGQGVSAQVSAYPDQRFAGTIVRILPGLNPQSRTLTVEAEIENVNGLLKPGQFATVRITQSKPVPAVMIPTSAVRTDGEINKVFVIKDGVANERIVQLGLLENDLIEVKQNVQEGEIVATSNLQLLGDGIIVRQ
ncbi:MAG TPA: efflux RND transporter periplasmic adaptor subunit [Pyrinomonadaceae bacterium]|nr:efflux RND transporter periplasmic adaptor subunit [Pyrinomonadaceae bacterium]